VGEKMVPMRTEVRGAVERDMVEGNGEGRGRGDSLMMEVRSAVDRGGRRVEATSGEGRMVGRSSSGAETIGDRRETNQGMTPLRPVDYIPTKYQSIFHFPYFNEMQRALLAQVFETDVSHFPHSLPWSYIFSGMSLSLHLLELGKR
jgi:hypothetical protein